MTCSGQWNLICSPLCRTGQLQLSNWLSSLILYLHYRLCTLLLEHCKIPHCGTNKGLPYLRLKKGTTNSLFTMSLQCRCSFPSPAINSSRPPHLYSHRACVLLVILFSLTRPCLKQRRWLDVLIGSRFIRFLVCGHLYCSLEIQNKQRF